MPLGQVRLGLLAGLQPRIHRFRRLLPQHLQRVPRGRAAAAAGRVARAGGGRAARGQQRHHGGRHHCYTLFVVGAPPGRAVWNAASVSQRRGVVNTPRAPIRFLTPPTRTSKRTLPPPPNQIPPLSQPTPVTVAYATADVTAAAGSDYTAASGTLSFAPDETRKNVTVYVIGDTAIEANETFRVTLSNPSGAKLGSPTTATVTILNDDTVGRAARRRVRRSISGPVLREGGCVAGGSKALLDARMARRTCALSLNEAPQSTHQTGSHGPHPWICKTAASRRPGRRIRVGGCVGGGGQRRQRAADPHRPPDRASGELCALGRKPILARVCSAFACGGRPHALAC